MRKSIPSRALLFSRFILFTALFVTAPFLKDAAAQESQGEQLFQACKACHYLTDQRLIGPGLEGVTERRDRDWLVSFIRNSQAMIDAGDSLAVALYEEYNKVPMPPFNYTDEQMDALLLYMASYDPEAEAQAAAEPEVTGPPAGKKAKGADEFMADMKHPWSNFPISFIISLVLIVLAILDLIFFKVVTARFIHLIIILISLAVITEITILEAQALGRQQYYSPDQPILFSHKVHAGQNQIDCMYCHTTARESKSAGIPSVQLCMNCHNVVREGTNTGKSEIDKIYQALENGKPIEWIRVHNLPDHAWFSHAQHVAAGGMDCAECHGDVAEMDRIVQVEDLSMGWCIECHRTKEVRFLENDFYSVYKELHEDLKEGRIERVTVDMVGGSECARCHY